MKMTKALELLQNDLVDSWNKTAKEAIKDRKRNGACFSKNCKTAEKLGINLDDFRMYLSTEPEFYEEVHNVRAEKIVKRIPDKVRDLGGEVVDCEVNFHKGQFKLIALCNKGVVVVKKDLTLQNEPIIYLNKR